VAEKRDKSEKKSHKHSKSPDKSEKKDKKENKAHKHAKIKPHGIDNVSSISIA